MTLTSVLANGAGSAQYAVASKGIYLTMLAMLSHGSASR